MSSGLFSGSFSHSPSVMYAASSHSPSVKPAAFSHSSPIPMKDNTEGILTYHTYVLFHICIAVWKIRAGDYQIAAVLSRLFYIYYHFFFINA